jgi:hypothetical protein
LGAGAVSDRFFRYGLEEEGGRAYASSEAWFFGRGRVAYVRYVTGGAPEDLRAHALNIQRRAPGGRLPRHVTIPPTYPYFQLGVLEIRFWFDRRHAPPAPGTMRPDRSTLQVVVPLWWAALPVAVLPAVSGWRWQRKRRRRARAAAGLCLRCGYDLRATSDRCPECGAVKEST